MGGVICKRAKLDGWLIRGAGLAAWGKEKGSTYPWGVPVLSYSV